MTLRYALIVLAAGVLSAGLGALGGCERKEPVRTVRVYAGAGLQPALDALAAEFATRRGIKVDAVYAGSGVIINKARLDNRADLFMPGDVWYLQQLQQAQPGLIESQTPVARLVPVIIVPKDSPPTVLGVADLFKPGLKVGLGSAKACQVGRVSDEIFAKNGLKRSDLAQLKETLTVNELGTLVATRDRDAAIVWDAVAASFSHAVRSIEIPEARNAVSHVVVGLMKTSADKGAAREFVDFMTSQAGRDILQRCGYRPEPR